MRGLLLSLVLLTASALAGCGGSNNFTYESYRATVGGVSVEIVPGGDEASSKADETKDAKGNVTAAVVTSGDVKVELKNPKRTPKGTQYDLIVNGVGKGTIVAGGDVVVQGGEIFVADPAKDMKSEKR